MRKEQTWQEQPVNNIKRQVRTSSSANRSFLRLIDLYILHLQYSLTSVYLIYFPSLFS